MQRKKKVKITIPYMCRPKKNSQQIIFNKRTHRPMIIQSEQYREFEKLCGLYLKPIAKELKTPINYPINLRCTFCFPDRRLRDLTNLENAIADILVKYKILEDDNYKIIQSWDGTRAYYEKDRKETIIEIEEVINNG